jgi:TDG/mug DNA glycosylase family protein
MSKDDLLFHPIPPVYDADSKILILGSFPSPRSRESSFYYGHPQNRFWPVLARVFGTDRPASNEEKIRFLLDRHIALWDVLASCTVRNADDSSIRNCTANDLSVILSAADIRAIFTTGSTAFRLYKRLCFPKTGIPAIALPSTSPANRRISIEELVCAYEIILEYL